MKYINCLNKYLKEFAKAWGYFTFFLIAGLIIFTYPMFVSNFDLMPGDACDVKSFTYILEHSYKWLIREAPHLSFIDIPFYYPEKHTLFYSDALIGLMPFYWIIRLFCSNPFTAVQIYLPILCLLNYSTFYYFLNKQLKFENLFSSVGAFLFAFSVLRYYRLCHLNYFSQFFTVLTLIFLFKINEKKSNQKNHIYFTLSVIFLALQFYTCFSYGFYFCFVGGFILITSLFFKKARENLISFIKIFYKKILLYSFVLMILLCPLIYFYLSVGLIRDIDEIYIYLQPVSAWIRNLSVLDCFILRDKIEFKDIYSAQELCASMGIFTTITALFGISKIKNYKYVFFLALIFIFLCSVEIGGFLFWKIFYNIIPGTQGIRAIIRISLMTLIILPVGVCYYLEYLKNKSTKLSKIFLILSVVLIFFEQIPHNYDINSPWKTYSWSKSKFMNQIEEYSKIVNKDSEVILFLPDYINQDKLSEIQVQDRVAVSSIYVNSLGVWVAMQTKKQTLNGSSGFSREIYLNDYKNAQVEYIIYDLTKVGLFEDK